MSISLFLIIWTVELVGLLLMNNIPARLRDQGGATVSNVSWMVFVNVVETAVSAAVTYGLVQVGAKLITGHLI